MIILTTSKREQPWNGGHKISVEVNGSRLYGAITDQGTLVDSSNPYMTYVISKLGQVNLATSGDCQLSLRAESIQGHREPGLRVASVKFVPVNP